MGINSVNQQPYYTYMHKYAGNNTYALNNNTEIFNTNPNSIETSVFAEKKSSKDGADDGSIGFLAAAGNLLKGVGNFVKGMFCDESGKFSLTRTLTTIGIGAAIGLACSFLPAITVAGTAFSTLGLISAGFLGLSAFHIGGAAIDIMSAKTDAQAEQAWQNMGTGLTEGLLAYTGYKASGGVFAKKVPTTASTLSTEIPRTNSIVETTDNQVKIHKNEALKETFRTKSDAEIQKILHKINNNESFDIKDFKSLLDEILIEEKQYYRDIDGNIVISETRIAEFLAKEAEIQKEMIGILQDTKNSWLQKDSIQSFSDFKTKYLELMSEKEKFDKPIKEIIQHTPHKDKGIDAIIIEYGRAVKNNQVNEFIEKYNLTQDEINALNNCISKKYNKVATAYKQYNRLYKKSFENLEKSENNWNKHKTTKSIDNEYTVFTTTTEGAPEIIRIKTSQFKILEDKLKTDYTFLNIENDHSMARLLQRIAMDENKNIDITRAYEILDKTKAKIMNPLHSEGEIGLFIRKGQTHRDALTIMLKNRNNKYISMIFNKDGKVITIINDIIPAIVDRYFQRINIE